MRDPLVIDTCSISDKGFCMWLRKYRGRKILPMVAFMEFYTFLHAKGRSYAEVLRLIRSWGIEIEPFNQKYARVAAETLHGAGKYAFLKHWRDHAIASHAHTAPLKVVTYDVEDFGFIAPRVISPSDLMKSR